MRAISSEKAKGFDEIVVAADVEAVDAVVDAAERGEKEDRNLLPDGAQRPHQRETIEAREHAIDDEDVVDLVHGLRQAVAAVGHGLGNVPLLREPVRDIGGGLGIVLDDKDAHGGRFRRRGKDSGQPLSGRFPEDYRSVRWPACAKASRSGAPETQAASYQQGSGPLAINP